MDDDARGSGGAKPSANKACTCCREAHSACDAERPCRRCIRLDRAHLCSDVPPRKRGRRPKNAEAAAGETQAQPRRLAVERRSEGGARHHDHPYYDVIDVDYGDGNDDNQDDDDDSGDGDRYRDSLQQSMAPQRIPVVDDPKSSRKKAKKASGSAKRARIKEEFASASATITINDAIDGVAASAHSAPVPTMAAADVDGLRRHVELLDSKFELLTQLLNSMAGDMKQVRQTNEALAKSIAETQTHIRDTDIVVADMLRAERERIAEKDKRAAIKQHNKALKKQRAQKRASEDPEAGLSPAAPNSSTSSSVISSPASTFNSRASFSFELSLLQSGVSPTVILEARQLLPWLCHYDVLPTRFAVVDFSYPVYVLEKMSNLEVPSRVSYANEAFMRLSGYSWSELIGMPFPNLFTGHERYLAQFSALLYNQPPMSVGIVYAYFPLLRCKDGSLLRLIGDRGQNFYNHHGQAQHCLKCVTAWEKGSLREGEGYDRWIPLRPALVGPHYEVKEPEDNDPFSAPPPVVLTDEISSQSGSALTSSSAALASRLASASPFPPVLPSLSFPPLLRPLTGFIGAPPPTALAQLPSQPRPASDRDAPRHGGLSLGGLSLGPPPAEHGRAWRL